MISSDSFVAIAVMVVSDETIPGADSTLDSNAYVLLHRRGTRQRSFGAHSTRW